MNIEDLYNIIKKIRNDNKIIKKKLSKIEEEIIKNNDKTNILIDAISEFKKEMIKLKSENIQNLNNKLDMLDEKTITIYQEIVNNNKKEIKIQIDPRTKHTELPNDAVVTYKYGARAFISNCYPGYVWRNLQWYEIKDGLTFNPCYATFGECCFINNYKKYNNFCDSFEPYIDATGKRIFIFESNLNDEVKYYRINTENNFALEYENLINCKKEQ